MARQEYPKWMYGPGDESRIFQKDEKVPKGWADHPSRVGKEKREPAKPVKAGGEAEPTPEERAATIAEVREAADAEGIQIELGDDATVEEINAAIDKLTKSTE